ncbi:helix-turn-helix domain-containing protein [Marinactinospora rubrisoli]|uniref:Scr1 family TA system antitoxin-like transcriptional regulator n=1 Tax=Marinactinospora rubrisoli TaxID=2715399 RepID=A0ABW2KNF9_9ACTN
MTDLRAVPPREEPANESRAAAYYALELKRYREEAQLTQEQLARKLGYGRSKVAMIEAAKRAPDIDFTRSCDRILGTGGALARILPLLDSRDAYPDWFRDFVGLEAEAVTLLQFAALTVPGLLQTETYARAVLSSSCPPLAVDQIERQTEARIRRQQVFEREPPLLAWFVIDESVLRRPVGGRTVMREQLEHLASASEAPHINLLVLPYSAGAHPGLDGSMTLLRLPDGDNLLYVEGPRSAKVTDRTEDVTPSQLAFITLCGQALPPSTSVELISQIAEKM